MLVRDLEAGIILIPRLAHEVALTLPPKKDKEQLMDAAYVVTNQTARTTHSFRPFVEYIQDLSGNWWTRDTGTTTTAAADLPAYKETYTAKASLIRRPQSALSLNLELLGSRTLEFSKLVVSLTQSRSSSTTTTATSPAKEKGHHMGHPAREKLLNVLHHHQNAAQRGLYHVRQTKGYVAEGLAIVSSPSFSARQEVDTPTGDTTSSKLTALHAVIASAGGQLRSWAVERSQRDKSLFSEDEAQRLWNYQGPMKDAPLAEG